MLNWTYGETQFRGSRLDCEVYGADSESMRRGSGGIAPLSSTRLTRVAHFGPPIHWIGGVGPQIGPDAYEKRKIRCLGRQSNSDSFTCPLDCAKPCTEKASSLFFLITQPQLTVAAFFGMLHLFSMYAIVIRTWTNPISRVRAGRL